MKRKHIDAAGNVIEREAPEETCVVGKIEAPITDPLELPSRAMRMQEPKPAPSWEIKARIAIAEFHAKIAYWVRRRVLLIPDVDLAKMQKAQVMIGQQHLGFSNMVAEVRLRLTFYERHDPQLGKLRRQFNDEERQRHERLAAKRARRAESPTSIPSDIPMKEDNSPTYTYAPQHPSPAEAVTASDEDEPA